MISIFGVKLCWRVFVTLLVTVDPPEPTAGDGHRAAMAYDAVLRVIHRLLRPSGVELLTRIAGLLLSAIAVQLVVGAIRAFVANG